MKSPKTMIQVYAENRRELLDQGKLPIKAVFDTAGNCTTCGESGRCPGWHGYKFEGTAGNWHRGAGNGEGSIFADEGRMRLEQGGTTLYPICNMQQGYDEAEDDANAALVAAAPELLQAAVAAAYDMQTGSTNQITLDRLLKAIRKTITTG